MNVLSSIYTIILNLLPYAVVFAAYWWLVRKALRKGNHKVFAGLALAFVASGILFTIIRLAPVLGSITSEASLDFLMIISNAVNFVACAIFIAFAEPEVEQKKQKAIPEMPLAEHPKEEDTSGNSNV